jgi:DNA repair exonuclease SbcCD ATPase subunit
VNYWEIKNRLEEIEREIDKHQTEIEKLEDEESELRRQKLRIWYESKKGKCPLLSSK